MLMDRFVIFVDPAYTSQECSSCSKRQKMPLKQRMHICSCGLRIPRDFNASLVIRDRGLIFFEAINPSSLALDA